jgi:hypothetical protein
MSVIFLFLSSVTSQLETVDITEDQMMALQYLLGGVGSAMIDSPIDLNALFRLWHELHSLVGLSLYKLQH